MLIFAPGGIAGPGKILAAGGPGAKMGGGGGRVAIHGPSLLADDAIDVSGGIGPEASGEAGTVYPSAD